MPHQDELFPQTSGFRPSSSLKEPRLWVRELRVYRVLAPGDGNVIRRIGLRPGLNILWARPRDRSQKAQLHVPGLSGHATGKTTFCRFIRHLLGEPAFGNDDQRAGLRSAFPEGWLVGEVRLDGESWLICRPFKVGPHPVAYRGRTIDSLFAGDEGRTAFDEYRATLDKILAEPLPVATFATSPTPITWQHLVQWLTRDQECRFAALADLRHPSSDSEAPDMAAEDRHFLFRAVLGLIDTAEQAELEKNKTYLAQRQRAEKDAPLLRFRGDSGLNRLRDRLPDFRTDLIGADFLDAVKTEWTKHADAFNSQLQQIREPVSLHEARTRLVESQGALHAARQQSQEVSDTLEWIEQQIKNLRGETTDSELDAWFRKKFPPDRFCGQPLSAAIEWDCPLAHGRKLPIEKQMDGVATKPTIDQLEERKRAENARLTKAHEVVKKHKNTTEGADANLQREIEIYDHTRSELSQEITEGRVIAGEAERALADQLEADRLQASLDDLDQKMRRSQERQSVIREQQNAALSQFSETFGRVSRAILGDDVTGLIRFRGRQMRPTLIHEIDLTSAALETLKIICFDLTALVSGVEGRGGHPRFLIHDGPREADMDAELYQRIFLLIAELETSFKRNPLSFQYIITTTEPPPPELQNTPWLLSPVLDATTREGKLLRGDF
ncbi:MAG: hypothetical protein WDM80_05330 [Limisphaerales bacterium]